MKKHLSGYGFSKWLNNVHTKQTDFWIKDMSSKAVKQAVMNGDRAFENVNRQDRSRKLEKRLIRQQRKLSRSYVQNKHRKEGEFCAKNRRKQLLVVQKLHARLANIRKEYIRFVASVLVKTKPAYIAIKDLNVSGMMKNRHLARAVASQNLSQFREFLIAKCLESGIEVRLVDRWFPFSKICSGCGEKNVSLSLADRIFICGNCDLEIDRDFNASLNLKYTNEYTVVTS